MNQINSSEKKLQRLYLQYQKNLPVLLDEIESGWKGVVDSHWSVEALERFVKVIHRIAGSSASYGYQHINTTTKMMETTLYEILENPIGATGEMQEKLETQLVMVQTAFQNNTVPKIAKTEELAADDTLRGARADRTIFLVEDDPFQAEEIAEQVSYFGYAVRIFTGLPDLVTAIKADPPHAVLMDVIFPEGFTAGPEAMIRLQYELESVPPVIFLSESSSLKSRLQAVRAGGQAYFTKPVDTGLLVDVLDQLTVQERQETYRVLIVDDAPVQAQITAEHLQSAGMQTFILTDPTNIMQPLEDFQPNIILLDTCMPCCTGPELAKVIRQIDEYIITPIIFLSTDEDREKQLEMLVSDSEDFIPKTIAGDRLKTIVRARIDRYRQLRSLMVRDSLTGLFNHTTIKERLEQELSRASRQNSTLCFAMIDLDHFKQVNDTYGHSAGDRVLKSLANFLTQRLRKTDIIGRYGGEEFAVILPDTPLEGSLNLLNELRNGFAHVHHRGDSKDFSVNLSAGLACYPAFRNPTALIEAADRALYQAKYRGRNQVVAAGLDES